MQSDQEVQIISSPPLTAVKNLLRANGLPIDDLPQNHALTPGKFKFFAYGKSENIRGVVGLELYREAALLRSLAVSVEYRKNGYGQTLVEKAEAYCRQNGILNIYLLTETARQFFEGLGYESISRDSVADDIRRTQEFSNLCPDDAEVMRKVL